MDGLRIVRARVRGSALTHDLRARFERRVEAALRGLDPGGAILCLREAGGALAAEAFSAPLGQTPRDWQAIVQQAQARAEQARQPWRETVTPDAAAVRFADTAEWLACAALDLLAQRIDRWWWCSLPRPGAAGVFAAWQQHPQAVPFALALLAQRGQAAHFADRAAAHASSLRHELLQHYAIGDAPAPLTDSPAVRALVQALSDCAEHAPADLGDAPRAWLWLALGLARVPSAVSVAPRPPAAWLAASSVTSELGATTPQAPAAQRPEAPALREQPPAAATTAQPGAAAPPPRQPLLPIRVRCDIGRAVPSILQAANDPQMPSSAEPESPALPAPAHGAARPAVRWAPPAAAADAPVPEGPTRTEGEADAPMRAAAGTLAQAGAASASAVTAAGEAGLTTAFGGVFHLLNLAVALSLYPDFTRPAERGLALHPWDFLALLARELIGPDFDADPLSGWLADAAGRPRDCAPALWSPPPATDWRLPADWLAPWAAQTRGWRCVEAGGRRALWHPAGFCVADVAGGDALRGELWPGWIAPRRVAHRADPAPQPVATWADWVARFAPFVRARLAVATGWPPDGAAQRLLCRPARIYRSAERLAVQMSLAALPIEVRLAGLDRDLGWLPAAGCDLRYRFDAGGAP